MLSFPDIDPDEYRVLTCDCSLELLPTESLQGIPTVTVKLSAGTDPNPSNILLGPPSFDGSGTLILQPVGNLTNLVGNDYEFEFEAQTTNPNKNIVIRGILPVRES